MKLTEHNLNLLPKSESVIVESLLKDLDSANNKVADAKLFIDWQDFHDTYSPERVDPCPDYYGCYRLMTENEKLYKEKFGYVDCTLSERLPLADFESVLYAITELIDFIK